jgi:hypothetical protein
MRGTLRSIITTISGMEITKALLLVRLLWDQMICGTRLKTA